MSVENVIVGFRANAKRLREIKDGGRDGQMNEYFNNQYADIWDAAASILEEDIRQSNRVHQDPT